MGRAALGPGQGKVTLWKRAQCPGLDKPGTEGCRPALRHPDGKDGAAHVQTGAGMAQHGDHGGGAERVRRPGLLGSVRT